MTRIMSLKVEKKVLMEKKGSQWDSVTNKIVCFKIKDQENSLICTLVTCYFLL